MSPADATGTGGSSGSRRLNLAVATIAVFAAAGPAIGAVAAILYMAATSREPGTALREMFPDMARAAYPIGIVPALIAGVAVAARDYFRATSFIEACLIGLVAGGIWGLFFGLNIFGLIIVGASIVASAACWRLTRRMRSPG